MGHHKAEEGDYRMLSISQRQGCKIVNRRHMGRDSKTEKLGEDARFRVIFLNAFSWHYITDLTVNHIAGREFRGDGGEDNTAGQEQNC